MIRSTSVEDYRLWSALGQTCHKGLDLSLCNALSYFISNASSAWSPHSAAYTVVFPSVCLCAFCPAGSEGFFGQGDPNQSKNPQAWAAQTGQNFLDDNRHMDFAVTHAWPDNWEM